MSEDPNPRTAASGDPDGLTVTQRTLVNAAHHAILVAQTTGTAMTLGDARREAYNAAHDRATRAITVAAAAGVSEQVLDATIEAATAPVHGKR